MINPIRSLHLQNFGPHQELRVDFADGLNLIRARNRSGKSWVLRALSLLFYNYCPAAYNKDDALCEVRYRDPGNPAARRAKFFAVTGEFADGSRVTRYRDADSNSYVIQRPGQEAVTYQAVGSGFFAPVGEVTGIYPLCLDGKTDYRLNVKLNTDPLFLLGESGQKQDDVLTRLLGLNVISAAETLTEKDIRELTADLNAATKEEAHLGAQAERLERAPAIKQQAEDLGADLKRLDALEARASRVAEMIRLMEGWKRQHDAAVRAGSLLDRALAHLEKRSARAHDLSTQAQTGHRCLVVALEAREEGRRARAALLLLETEIPRLEHLVDRAASQARIAARARELLEARTGLAGQRGTLAREEAALQAQLQQAQTQYQQALKDAGVCPLCGQPTR